MNAAHAFTMIESAVMIAELRRRIGRLFGAREEGKTAEGQVLVDELADNCLDDADLMRLLASRWEAAQGRQLSTSNHFNAADFIEEFEDATGLAILRA